MEALKIKQALISMGILGTTGALLGWMLIPGYDWVILGVQAATLWSTLFFAYWLLKVTVPGQLRKVIAFESNKAVLGAGFNHTQRAVQDRVFGNLDQAQLAEVVESPRDE